MRTFRAGRSSIRLMRCTPGLVTGIAAANIIEESGD